MYSQVKCNIMCVRLESSMFESQDSKSREKESGKLI